MVKPDVLPANIAGRLRGLRAWQFGSDYLVTRYASDGNRLQIVVSKLGIGVLVVPGKAASTRPGPAHALKVARGVLLIPAGATPRAGGIPVAHLSVGTVRWGSGTWSGCGYLTDGRFVWFRQARWALDPRAPTIASPPSATWPPTPQKLFE